MTDELDDIFLDEQVDRRIHKYENRILPAARGECGTLMEHTPEEIRGYRVKYPAGALRKKMAKMYKSAAWRRLREQVLRQDPICVYCRAKTAEHADHIVPPRGDKHLFFDITNVQGLCVPCHNQKTLAGL